MATGTAHVTIAVSPGPDPSVLCRGCGAPFGVWDTLHPLFRSWSGKCPDCHTRDIQLDFAHQNADDA